MDEHRSLCGVFISGNKRQSLGERVTGVFLFFRVCLSEERFLEMKSKWKKWGITFLAATAMVVITGCQKQSRSNGTIKIGILQLIDQKALNAAKRGFTEELAQKGYHGSKLKIDFLNANGDQSNLTAMSARLAQDHNTLNLAIATPAAQALHKAAPKTPLLFTAITDPKSAGLMTDTKRPDRNATGVTDLVNVKGQIDFTHRLFPKAKTVGLLYNAAEPNSVYQIKLAEKELKRLKLKVVVKTAATTNDVEQAAQALSQKADVIYVPTDNVAAAAMPTIGKVSAATKTPVVNADATMIKYAGVATVGVDYEDLGRQTAKMAIALLKGKKPRSLPLESPAKLHLKMNASRMKQFHVTAAQARRAAKAVRGK